MLLKYRQEYWGIMSLKKLEKEVAEAGGRIEFSGPVIRLVFPRRGMSLADFSLEALEAFKEFNEIVVIEEGAGENGSNYYYYIKPNELDRLRLLKKSGQGT